MWLSGGHYQQWADFLDRWARGDLDDGVALPPLDATTFQGDTWARLADRIVAAVQQRLSLWSRRLTVSLSSCRDEAAVGRALVQSRQGLVSVLQLADHPGLPAEVRQRLRAMVEQAVTSAQEGLEQSLRASALRDRAFVERRRRTLRDNRLTAVLEYPTPPAAAPAVSSAAPAAPASTQASPAPRRRIMFDPPS